MRLTDGRRLLTASCGIQTKWPAGKHICLYIGISCEDPKASFFLGSSRSTVLMPWSLSGIWITLFSTPFLDLRHLDASAGHETSLVKQFLVIWTRCIEIDVINNSIFDLFDAPKLQQTISLILILLTFEFKCNFWRRFRVDFDLWIQKKLERGSNKSWVRLDLTQIIWGTVKNWDFIRLVNSRRNRKCSYSYKRVISILHMVE